MPPPVFQDAGRNTRDTKHPRDAVDGPQGAVAAVGVCAQGWHEAGATASLGHPEGSTYTCSGAETAKKARRDSYLKIKREQGEKLYAESTAQFVSAHQSTLTRMEAFADEDIIQADTVVDDELEGANARFLKK